MKIHSMIVKHTHIIQIALVWKSFYREKYAIRTRDLSDPQSPTATSLILIASDDDCIDLKLRTINPLI